MRTFNSNLYRLLFGLIIFGVSCNKRDALDEIPDSDLLVIKTKEDALALLDNTTVMAETPSLMEVAADNFYLFADSSLQINAVELNAYLWKPDVFEKKQTRVGDWFNSYQQVYYANSIISKLSAITNATPSELNQLKGTSLFIRGYAFYNIALEFASLYSVNGPNTGVGIPLRLSPEPEASSVRASLTQTYEQILQDIQKASTLLPQTVDAIRKNRPSIPACYALLARIYLSMSDYTNARAYADSCLRLYTKLLDYNSFKGASDNPFHLSNEEILYQSNLNSQTGVFFSKQCYVDSTLYNSFSDQDLRKELYFDTSGSGRPLPRFSYTGTRTRFSGLAVDEVLLIRAECNARLGFKDEALNDMVFLLTKRYKGGIYIPPPVNSATEALSLVLEERRKELVFRGLRWTDIRRFNKSGASITLRRLFEGTEVILPPGDNRYIFPIPPDVIALNTNMPQNPR